MITRREAVRLLGVGVAGAFAASQTGFGFCRGPNAPGMTGKDDSTPLLAPGTPTSPERVALIDIFKQKSEGLQNKYEARTYKNGWVMPYRLFRPEASGKLPLVVFLHGSGGQGDDNLKQLGLGNIFGTRVWLLPENQKNFPCYVLAPQTDRGWIHYDTSQWAKGKAGIIPGLGDGAGMVLKIIDVLRHEFPIDDRRIYVMGQSMGGGGTWNVITFRPNFFAAAVICCGSVSMEDGTASVETPVWAFHGDSDQTVPVSVSRERIAARRKAGGHPVYTEYVGVDHNVWEWAFTEPGLVTWLFAQRRS